MCKRHVRSFRVDQCPSCRDAPFRYEENIPLQRIIAEVRSRLGLPIPEESSDDQPDAAASIAAQQAATGARGDAVPQVPQADPRYGSKVPLRNQSHGFAKRPNEAHDAAMLAHVRACEHEQCRSLWSGPWGKFIGGANGRTHFDLTDCMEGRRLNELIGWNYDDPAM
eukprot:CAMPEP_0171102188 /NCGR_PEP_ID=MMETSP0766_2-20121228/57106_1 /TAXON_ID=439317 /ORGANISM="Gambierdiscus australes, Strain CAWD 149" /LENGTH=166 /DNA_ID=CAMNT_0011562423 /DNA_START=116 /DNA_END=616 /DNA_ORIENTATION=+